MLLAVGSSSVLLDRLRVLRGLCDARRRFRRTKSFVDSDDSFADSDDSWDGGSEACGGLSVGCDAGGVGGVWDELVRWLVAGQVPLL